MTQTTLSTTTLVIIAFLPLLTATLVGIFGTAIGGRILGNKASHTLTIGGVLVSCVLSVMVLMQVALLLAGPAAAALVMQLAMTTVIMPLYVGSVYAAWKQMFAHRRQRVPPPVAEHIFEA